MTDPKPCERTPRSAGARIRTEIELGAFKFAIGVQTEPHAEGAVSARLAVPGVGIYLRLDAPFGRSKWWARWFAGWHGRHLGIYIHDWALWWELWATDDWHAGDPLWQRGNYRLADWRAR